MLKYDRSLFQYIAAAVVVCDEPVFFAEITTHEYSRTVKTTKCFAPMTGFRILCSILKDSKKTNCYEICFYLLLIV